MLSRFSFSVAGRVAGWLALLCLLGSCTSSREGRPLQILLVPSQDKGVLLEKGALVKVWLEKDLKRQVEIQVPVNYTTIIEAFGGKRVDVALMNSFGYLLARAKHGAQVRLIAVSQGKTEYFGQIIARKGRINGIQELKGKKWGFVSPASGSGYVAALKFLQNQNLKADDFTFFGSHDAVVTAVYQGRVDVGATFYAEDEGGVPQDARRLVKTQFPDVFEKLERVSMTGPLPNEVVVVRADLSETLKFEVTYSLQKFIRTEAGKKIFRDLYHYEDLVATTDAPFLALEKDLETMGLGVEKLIDK